MPIVGQVARLERLGAKLAQDSGQRLCVYIRSQGSTKFSTANPKTPLKHNKVNHISSPKPTPKQRDREREGGREKERERERERERARERTNLTKKW